MGIAIVELHYHEEFISTLYSLFKDSDDVTIFTTLDVKNNLSSDIVDDALFVVCNGNKKDFIESIPVGDFDRVFVNTIQPSMVDLWFWKYYPASSQSVLTLHNLYAWRNKSFVPRLNMFRSFDSYFAGRYTDMVLSKFSVLNVVYEPMIRYAQDLFPLHKVIHIPFALAQDNIDRSVHDDMVFVIPGTVSNTRRDYGPVIEAFDRLYEKHKHIQLVLLGENRSNVSFDSKPYVTCFNSRVPVDEYDSILRNADFVICPSVEKTWTVNTASEWYGKTKSSNLSDAIKWRQPVIIPEYIPFPEGMSSSVLTYKNSMDLYGKLERVLSDSNYFTYLKEEAVRNCNLYSGEQVKKRLWRDLFEKQV